MNPDTGRASAKFMSMISNLIHCVSVCISAAYCLFDLKVIMQYAGIIEQNRYLRELKIRSYNQ